MLLALSHVLTLTLAVGAHGPQPPAEAPDADVPVQSPATGGPPTLPEVPGAAADVEAPAEPPTDESEPADEAVPGPEATVAEPPQPEPSPVATADPIPPTLPEGFEDESPFEAEPATLDRDWVTIEAPRWRGTGMYVGAGLLYASALTFQAIDGLLCGNCGLGVTERIFLSGTMGLAAGAGVLRGRADAYDDTALRRPRRDTKKILIAGAVMTGAGAVLGLVNDGMWWSCAIRNTGPYVVETDFASVDCRYGLSRGLLDLATATTAAGGSMLSWSLVYRRDSRAYSRARIVGLRPNLGRGRFGLSLQGRF